MIKPIWRPLGMKNELGEGPFTRVGCSNFFVNYAFNGWLIFTKKKKSTEISTVLRHLQMMSIAFSVGAISCPLPDGVQRLKDIWYLRSSVVSCQAEWTKLSYRHVWCTVRARFIMCRSHCQVYFGHVKYMMWIICPELLVIPLWQGRNNTHLYMWPSF